MKGFFVAKTSRRAGNFRKKHDLIALPSKSKIFDIPNVIVVHELSIPDMNNIHSFSLKYFHNQELRIPEIKSHIEREKLILNTQQTYIERKESIDLIDKLEKELSDIVNGEIKRLYLEEITPTMEIYKKLLQTQDKSVFGINNKEIEDIETSKYMLSFLETVKKYTNIRFHFEICSKYQCVECEFDLSNVIPEIDGTIRCPECRVENESNRCPKMLMPFNKGINTHHGDYSERLNFHKFIRRLQGQCETHISNDLWDKLDIYFAKEKIPLGKAIRKLEHNHKGFKDGVSLSTMLGALSYYGYSNYYDDIYVICSKYWGWILPEFKEDENVIMYIYDITQVAYSKIENKTRSSSISIPYIAFKITEMLNYPYEVSDFKIPKDDKSREETEHYWKISCETCGDPEVMYIPTRKY